MPAASKMEEQVSLPNVSIPCHNEQRDKKKRYTVSVSTKLFSTKVNDCFFGDWVILSVIGVKFE